MRTEISTEGDFNGGGINDLLVTARTNDTAGHNAGAASIIFRKTTGFDADFDVSTLDGPDGFQVVGLDRAGTNSNSSEADSVGDFNGDCINDMVFGSRQAHAGIPFGKSEPFAKVVDFRFITDAGGQEFISNSDRSGTGKKAAAGDLNGDGLMDIVIGDTELDNDTGAAQSIFGSSGSEIKVVGTTTDDSLVGTRNGDDILIGDGGDDTLSGGAGLDRLVGGNGVDTFIFANGGGLDLIGGFTTDTDQIDVSDYGFADFAALSARISTVNGKAVINFATGGRAILLGVDATTLDADDFILN